MLRCATFYRLFAPGQCALRRCETSNVVYGSCVRHAKSECGFPLVPPPPPVLPVPVISVDPCNRLPIEVPPRLTRTVIAAPRDPSTESPQRHAVKQLKLLVQSAIPCTVVPVDVIGASFVRDAEASWRNVGNGIIRFCSLMSCSELCSAVSLYAKIRFRDAKVLYCLSKEMETKLQRFSLTQVIMIFHSFVKLDFRHKLLETRVVPFIHGCLQGCIKISILDSHKDLIDKALTQQDSQFTSSLNSRTVSKLFCAFAKWRCCCERRHDIVSDQSKNQTDSGYLMGDSLARLLVAALFHFDEKDICMCVSALSQVRWWHIPFFSLLCGRILDATGVLCSKDAQDLSHKMLSAGAGNLDWNSVKYQTQREFRQQCGTSDRGQIPCGSLLPAEQMSGSPSGKLHSGSCSRGPGFIPATAKGPRVWNFSFDMISLLSSNFSKFYVSQQSLRIPTRFGSTDKALFDKLWIFLEKYSIDLIRESLSHQQNGVSPRRQSLQKYQYLTTLGKDSSSLSNLLRSFAAVHRFRLGEVSEQAASCSETASHLLCSSGDPQCISVRTVELFALSSRILYMATDFPLCCKRLQCGQSESSNGSETFDSQLSRKRILAGQTISDITYSFTKIGIRNTILLHRLSPIILRLSDTFSLQHIWMASWTYSFNNFRDCSVFDGLWRSFYQLVLKHDDQETEAVASRIGSMCGNALADTTQGIRQEVRHTRGTSLHVLSAGACVKTSCMFVYACAMLDIHKTGVERFVIQHLIPGFIQRMPLRSVLHVLFFLCYINFSPGLQNTTLSKSRFWQALLTRLEFCLGQSVADSLSPNVSRSGSPTPTGYLKTRLPDSIRTQLCVFFIWLYSTQRTTRIALTGTDSTVQLSCNVLLRIWHCAQAGRHKLAAPPSDTVSEVCCVLRSMDCVFMCSVFVDPYVVDVVF
eukprot:GHVQ01023187.1.p1 GENE.GHVQ01023187.1~~GHVQ01023187.1.p1  ORF type:complete len:922 (-),score=56.35 GHVQ01023187.1:1118-3883(-)